MQEVKDDTRTAFESAAQEERASIASEFVYFLKENKKWWLAPILIVLLMLALLTFFAGTGAAPFLYTMF
jgi:Family of unknown function (DUF5989)